MAGVDVVDELGGLLEFVAGFVQAGAFQQGDGLGFGAGVRYADDLPRLERRADVAGFAGRGGPVHGEKDDGQAFGGDDVVGGARLDAPASFEADVFGAQSGPAEESGDKEGFSE